MTYGFETHEIHDYLSTF